MLLLLGAWALLSLVYLLLVGQLSADEIGLALACGLGAAVWSAAIRKVSVLRFRFEPTAAAVMITALAKLPRAMADVAIALIRARSGTVIREPFVRGRDLDPADAARRAVVLLAVSLTPDKFALRIARGRDEIDLHSLVGPPAPADMRWPV